MSKHFGSALWNKQVWQYSPHGSFLRDETDIEKQTRMKRKQNSLPIYPNPACNEKASEDIFPPKEEPSQRRVWTTEDIIKPTTTLRDQVHYSVLSFIYDEGFCTGDAVDETFDRIIKPLLIEAEELVEEFGSYVSASLEVEAKESKASTEYREKLLQNCMKFISKLKPQKVL